ncbi:MAG TPA: glycosyltransferase family 39 protein [Bryobacteraceae bacterium]|nr:glycosyltransferase family 39 protein [Bryobacteraceae bacterium]
MLAALLIAALTALTLVAPAKSGLRARFLTACVLFGLAVVAGAEFLSLFNLLHRTPLILWWIAVTALAPFVAKRLRLRIFKLHRISIDLVSSLAVIGIAAILLLTAVTAAASPPNTWDAMAYHLPRVLYWAEQGSVRFFPTQYLNQIMLQPLAEYFMLHLYVLTGSDHFSNFVQWFGWLGSAVTVSLIARQLGADTRAQACAALFCATIPLGILASTGAKNDCLLAFWMAAATYFALEYAATRAISEALLLGLSTGLALLTKGTAYIFLPWILLVVLARALRYTPISKLLPGAAVACLCALALNTPLYIRNYTLSGSPLGFDSAQGDGFFRWRNERFGWKPTVSNLLRNASEQLGMREASWNNGIFSAVIAAHRKLGIDPQDPATTWRWTAYHPPSNPNHETDRPAVWHLAILVLAAGVFCIRAIRGRNRFEAAYVAAFGCGILAFCFYLKWQPFGARFFLPLFVLASPLVASFAGRARKHDALRQVLLAAVVLFLLDGARRPLLDNWVRPLRGPDSVLHRDRDTQYFADMTTVHNADAYRKSVAALAKLDCGLIGVDSTDFQLEYPFEALLRERKPGVLFIHTAVENPSKQYDPPVRGEPCAVVCLECAADTQRVARYSQFTRKEEFDKFVVLSK